MKTIIFLILFFPSKAFSFPGSFTQISINLNEVGIVAGVVVTALSGLWGVRKVIKMINRS